MSKARETKNLEQRRTSSPLLAISLAASLAAFGCTTNHNVGNGTPTRSGPDVRTAPTSGVTSGSEGETPVLPPPMTSASLAPVPAISRADAAAAIMAQHQPSRGRYLGVVNPGPAGRGYVSDGRVTGQLVPPALLANPQLTVNPSISSDGVAVINSGDALATTAVTNGAATALPAGTFASGGTTLPTAASSGIPTVTGAGALATTPLAATAGTIAPTAVAGGSTLPATASSAIPTVTGASGVGVQIVRGTNGAATITNTTATSTAPATAPATTNTSSGNQ